MKKSIFTLMAFAITAVLMSGCSTNPPASETVSSSTAATSAAPANPAATSASVTTESSDPLRIGSLKGPTSMGLVSLMDQTSKGESMGSYEFTMVTAADELLAKMIGKELDIALVPANMASILYQKTEGGVRVIDINTLGVLYVVSSDHTIQSIGDLKGKTVYLTGKGTTPDYVFQYLLDANALTTQDVKLEYKSEAAEVAAILTEQPDAVGLLPQPFVTVACAQNEALSMVLDLTAEWEQIQGENGGSLVTGVTVVRTDLLSEQEDDVLLFMEEHQASAKYVSENVEEAAELVAQAGIIEKAPIAQKAIPYCSITYLDGAQMKTMLQGYLQVLYDQDPKTIGGNLPKDDFYFIK